MLFLNLKSKCSNLKKILFMKIVHILGLLILVILLWFLKFPLEMDIKFFICSKIGSYCHNFSNIYSFMTIFLFPFLLSISFGFLFLKYRKNYGVISQWILKIILILSIIFSAHSFLWVCPIVWDFLPILGGFFGGIMIAEIYLSVSLVLLFLCTFVLALRKKK